MAPLRCPACRQEVSRTMGACPGCGHAFPGPAAGNEETIPPPPSGGRRSRGPALLLAVLAVPGFAVNPILGAVLAVAALNVWTKLGKQPILGPAQGEGPRRARRWVVGGLSVLALLVAASVVWVIHLESRIEEHLVHSWRRHVESTGREAGLERMPDLRLVADDTFTFDEEGTYRLDSATAWRWKAEGHEYELVWAEVQTGDWTLGGNRLTTTPRRNEAGWTRLRVDGEIHTDPEERIPFFEREMSAGVLKKAVTDAERGPRDWRVKEIDAHRLVLRAPPGEGKDPMDFHYVRVAADEDSRAFEQFGGSR